MGGGRLGVRLHPPRLGDHTRELLPGAGFQKCDIDELLTQGIIA